MKRVLGDSVMAIFQIHVRIRTRSGSAIGPGWGSDGSFDSELELPEDLRGTGGAALNAVQADDLPEDVLKIISHFVCGHTLYWYWQRGRCRRWGQGHGSADA